VGVPHVSDPHFLAASAAIGSAKSIAQSTSLFIMDVPFQFSLIVPVLRPTGLDGQKPLGRQPGKQREIISGERLAATRINSLLI
jgi:hypothetical protein